MVGSFEKTIVRLVATRRPGWLSDGSRRSRNGVVPVAPLSSRATTMSLVIVSPALLRQPKYATYTVLFCATAGRIEGPFWPSVLRDSMRRDVNVAPPFSETSTVAVRPSGGGADEGLVDVGPRRVLCHRRGREDVVRLEVFECDAGRTEDRGVECRRFAPGVGDVGGLRVTRQGVAQRPGVAAVARDVDRRRRARRPAGVWRERGGGEDVGIGRECREKGFCVLPRLAAQRRWDHVHDAHTGGRGRGGGGRRRGRSIRWVWGSLAGCDEERDRGEEGGGAHG